MYKQSYKFIKSLYFSYTHCDELFYRYWKKPLYKGLLSLVKLGEAINSGTITLKHFGKGHQESGDKMLYWALGLCCPWLNHMYHIALLKACQALISSYNLLYIIQHIYLPAKQSRETLFTMCTEIHSLNCESV